MERKIVTKQTKENMKKSKIKYHQKFYKWELVEDYLDMEIKHSNWEKRKRKFITFRVFRDLINSGKSIRDLAKDGYSMHILRFLCRFAKGSITTTKEQLLELYKDYDLNEIAKKIGIDRGDLCLLRQLYKIDLLESKYLRRIIDKRKPSKRQEQIIVGGLLGDSTRHGKRVVRFKHGDCQKKYIAWKYKQMENLTSGNGIKASANVSEKYNLDNICWSFTTRSSTDVEKWITEFYKLGYKEISYDILNVLNPLGLAIWFMDDGSTNWKSARNGMVQICTQSFCPEPCKLIVDYFLSKWNIHCHLSPPIKKQDGKEGCITYIQGKSREDFFDIVRPHILPMFQYKIDYNAYLKWREAKEKALAIF